MEVRAHRLHPIKQIMSPNVNARPASSVIDMIVIHGISLPPGEFGNDLIERLFTNQLDGTQDPLLQSVAHLRVSAHVVIYRNGDIVQFVPFNQRAWHAGQSSFMGRDHCNDYAIGIELEGTDTIPYTAAQYSQLVKVVVVLMQTYPAICVDRIVGHCDVAPGRKTDPGESFNWSAFRVALQARLVDKKGE